MLYLARRKKRDWFFLLFSTIYLDDNKYFISRCLDMEDNEGKEENAPRGNDWEVVSLTASTYAAAPGPKEVELKDDENEYTNGQDEAETSNALFMSGHFVFPSSQHENLPLEPDGDEVRGESGGKGVISEEEGARPNQKDEENWFPKGLASTDDFPGITLLDEKVEQLPFQSKQFEVGPGLSLVDEEESIYTAAEYGSFNDEAALSGMMTQAQGISTAESNEPSKGSNQDMSPSLNVPEDEKDNYTSDLPCEAWWKRRAASLYAHAKDANAFWSIFIAATVMGLVMIGQRWQQERWEALHVKSQIRLNNEDGIFPVVCVVYNYFLSVISQFLYHFIDFENLPLPCGKRGSRMLVSISRLKDVIVGGHRHGSLVRSGSASEN